MVKIKRVGLIDQGLKRFFIAWNVSYHWSPIPVTQFPFAYLVISVNEALHIAFSIYMA